MSCIFCDIAAGKQAAQIAYQNDHVLAFRDIHPQAPTHILIIPRKHVATVNDLDVEDTTLVGEMFLAARTIAAKIGCSDNGYRLVMNCNRDAGQTVYHIHLHFLAGRHFTWPPG